MNKPASTETVTLGGGCFWCLEPIFKDLQGVEQVVSGYSGGHVESPSYEQVCTGTTGHAEVVQVTFNREEISFRDLLTVFFTVHDPTTRDRQGADVGPQYRSVIFYHTPVQRATAGEVIRELEQTGDWDDPIVTELTAFETFYPAEGYHQDYYKHNPHQPYCRLVIDPKVNKFKKTFAGKLKGEI